MNKLSLFLYFADMIGNLQALLILGIITCVVVLGIGFDKKCYDEYGSQDYPFFAMSLGYHTRYVVLLVFLAVFAAVIPSERTMYLIAASESAEVVINSQEAKDTFGLLKEALTKVLQTKN